MQRYTTVYILEQELKRGKTREQELQQELMDLEDSVAEDNLSLRLLDNPGDKAQHELQLAYARKVARKNRRIIKLSLELEQLRDRMQDMQGRLDLMARSATAAE
ncbi:MAG: hypothetical protein ACOX18_02870 [Bacillota bacterium]